MESLCGMCAQGDVTCARLGREGDAIWEGEYVGRERVHGSIALFYGGDKHRSIVAFMESLSSCFR